MWRIFVQKDRPRSRYYFDCKPIVNRILCSGHIRPPPATILDPIWTTWVFGTSILSSCSTNSHRFEKFLIRYCKWYSIGWANFSKSSQIEPLFLYSMCMGKIRSHAKFQVSSFNILKWQPLFVNQSWHWESHLKWPESGTFDLAPFIGIKNALQNGITLGVLDFRKYVKRLDGNW